MSEPYLAEIRLVGFNFAPRGWALCDGQILAINQYQSLFSLLGTTYGGDGRTSFALPDLRGRVPIHRGQADAVNFQRGDKGGTELHVLTTPEIPNHQHTIWVSSREANATVPADNYLAEATSPFYGPASNLVAMDSDALRANGGGAGHENMMPYQVLNYIIATTGTFPPRS